MPATDFSPEAYNSQLQEKIEILQQDFANFAPPAIEIFRSPEKYYRMRAEFRVWHSEGRADCVMFSQEDKRPYPVREFLVGSELINQLIAQLMDAINANELLKRKLFQVEFLTTLSGEALITLIYHTALNAEWETAARALKTQLGVDIIGRSRKQKILLDRDHVIENLKVNGKTFSYQQVEGSFTQPNAKVCEQMLSWAVNKSANFGGDLLELYCGNGNFTLPLAQNFNQVLATEVSKTSVESALFNRESNQVENLKIARMSSEEFTQAMDGVREFNRLKHVNLSDYHFSTLFVDPPRAGMDPLTTQLAQRFDNIIYISCNPHTLHENLKTLTQSHDITAFAAFDQFPYTYHLECGVILRKKT